MPMVAWVPGRAHGPLVGSALTGLRSADTWELGGTRSRSRPWEKHTLFPHIKLSTVSSRGGRFKSFYHMSSWILRSTLAAVNMFALDISH